MATRALRSIEKTLVLVAEETGVRAGLHPESGNDDEAFLAKRVEAAAQHVVRTPTASELAGLEQTGGDLQRRLEAAHSARASERAALAEALGRAGAVGRPAWTGPLTSGIAALGAGFAIDGGPRAWAIVIAVGAVVALNTTVLAPVFVVVVRAAVVATGCLQDALLGSVWQWRRAAVARKLTVARVRAAEAPALRSEFNEQMLGLVSTTYRIARGEGALLLTEPPAKGSADGRS